MGDIVFSHLVIPAWVDPFFLEEVFKDGATRAVRNYFVGFK